LRGPVLAVDVGGTKLAAGVVDADGRVLRAGRRPTPVTTDGEEVWSVLTGLVEDVLAGVTVSAVGVGCGGPMRWPEGEVSPLNIPGWRDFPLRARLEARFPGTVVRLHNDAVCLAVAEHWRGAARGHADALGMVVSTGVGGGLVLGGRLVDGASGNAGHVGHVVVEPDGPGCSCGGRGCLEALAAGPRVAAWAVEQGWRGGSTARELAADAVVGDAVAVAAFARAGRALGVAIASAAALCDLTVVVLGGGVMQAGPLVLEPLRVALREHAVMGFTRDVPVVPAALGQEAGLVGAAALVLAGDSYWSGDVRSEGRA
jgi:glucokinase